MPHVSQEEGISFAGAGGMVNVRSGCREEVRPRIERRITFS